LVPLASNADQAHQFDDGGYAVIRNRDATVITRYPRYRFRPSDCDALHVDFWLSGQNLTRDGGTYCYFGDPEAESYFRGVKSHNTIQFDDRDQMPKVGRFLWGQWLKTTSVRHVTSTSGALEFAAEYEDAWGCRHRREVELRESSLVVRDSIAGPFRQAVLRWRLQPGDWRTDCDQVSNKDVALKITTTAPIARCEMREGWESRYYMQRASLPVFEVEVRSPCQIETQFSWQN
jgi:hypothetical protein